jgi:predicted DCC family thiol-disulfide oxidoreductase YuxK
MPFPVAVMDASCALCTFGAQMIDRLDRAGEIRICPVQSPQGAALLAAHGLSPADPESWLYLENGQAYEGFAAMAAVGARTGGWGHALRLLRLIPGPIARALYRLIARNRYRLFGRSDLCALPSASLRARLIR